MNNEVASRLRDRITTWRVSVERVVETESSILAFGCRDQLRVVLKVVRRPGDEWFQGRVLECFGGHGVVEVLEQTEGAALLDRLVPGNAIADTPGLDDEDATAILADVIRRMCPDPPPSSTTAVEAWGKGFDRYAASGDTQIPRSLVHAAHRTFAGLCASQAERRLLHGDLHHHNVLLDAERGWLAIDPKGVVGELAYELGAALRNPWARPDVFTTPDVITKRVDHFARVLVLDKTRILAWAFAQAVLSAIWEVEDTHALSTASGCVVLAHSLHRMLGS